MAGNISLSAEKIILRNLLTKVGGRLTSFLALLPLPPKILFRILTAAITGNKIVLK
mgnify:CR=1 FL=1